MRPPSHDHKRRGSPVAIAAARRAVTIVELIVVVMIMSIMAAAAAPTFFETLLYHRVESAARRVKADLELARHTARLKSSSQSIVFTTAGYSLSGAVTGLDDPNAAYSVDLTTAPYDLRSVSANFSNGQTISFDGYGVPSSGGSVVLSSQGHRCTVTLDGVTGEVSITSNHVRGG